MSLQQQEDLPQARLFQARAHLSHPRFLQQAQALIHQDIFKIVICRIVCLHRRVRVDVADCPVIVGGNFNPIMYSSHNDFGGENIGQCIVLKPDASGRNPQYRNNLFSDAFCQYNS